MSYLACQLLTELERDLEDADFWERWQNCLHPDEARAIASGEIGVIRRRFEPDWTPGEWIDVASNLWLCPEAPKFTPRKRIGWRIAFRLRDFRVRIPRRTPGMFEAPETDDDGRPIPPGPTAIEAARLDGSYTAAHALAVPECDESIDELAQRRIDLRAREQITRRIGDDIAAMEEVRSALDDLLKKRPHMTSTIGRELWQIRGRIDAAKKNLKRRQAARQAA
jgi:hypothetical protein